MVSTSPGRAQAIHAARLIPLAQEPVNHFLGHLVAYWPTWFRAGRSISRAAGPALAILFLSASAIHDRLSEGRVHPVSLWVPLLLLAWMFVLPSVVFPSVAWHQFAAWIVR